MAYALWVNDSSQPIELFQAEWIVPAEPLLPADQTIFLFIGLQNRQFILQPVLQWGPSFAGGGPYWSVAHWYTNGQTGETFVSSSRPVAAGMRLRAGIELVAQDGRSFCYKSWFNSHPRLELTLDGMQECLYAFVVLEVHGCAVAGHYPAVDSTLFESLRLMVDGRIIEPRWRVNPRRTEPGSACAVREGEGVRVRYPSFP